MQRLKSYLTSLKSNSHFHSLSWIAGLLCLLVAFVQGYQFYWDEVMVPVRLGGGHLADNILISLALATSGATLGGYWWRLIVWLKGEICLTFKCLSFIFLSLGIAGMMTPIDKSYFYISMLAILLVGLLLAYFTRIDKSRHLPQMGSAIGWLREKSRINSSYFILFYLFLIANNGIAILSLSSSWLEKLSAFTGRALFYAGAIALFSLLVELYLRSAPRFFRKLSWILLGMIPFMAIVDLWTIMSLGRPARGFINSQTTTGEFDLIVLLEGGGMNATVTKCVFFVLGVVLTAAAVSYLCWKLSLRKQPRLSFALIFGLGVLATSAAIAEQGVGSLWKRRSAWQAEHKAIHLQLNVFSPPSGVGNFKVEFFDHSSLQNPLKLAQNPSLTQTPDIYIIMVESMRADAMNPATTPFMSHFEQTECQSFGSTWSGSNATHLSWFSMMHSKLPIYWKRELQAIDKKNFHGPETLKWLKQAGYNIEMRAVCDLSYMDFGLLNFGTDTKLVNVLEQKLPDTPFSDLNIPEREVVTFDRLKQAVKKNGEGKNFYFTALDSPHYGYYWHNDFTPPLQDYIDKASFPLYPSEHVVKLYHNRYLNACSWIDHQVKDFCEFLKKEGRYDNSIIIVTGDHGEEFQEHGRWCHCSSLYPEQTQVPLLIKWPKSVGRGPAKDKASHLDIMPTLLQHLGAPKTLTQSLAGYDLLDDAQPTDHTIISTTAFAGNTGETLVLRRGPHTAYFSWPRYWLANVPSEMALERIETNGELVHLESPQAYHEKLKEIFPDAFEKYIKSLEVVR